MFGLDLLGAAKYPRNAIKSFPQDWAIGVFSSTFGDSRPFIRRLLATGKCPRVRVHLLWRDRHDFSLKHLREAEREFKKWFRLMSDFPTVDWQFSAFCEHNLNRADALKVAEHLLFLRNDFTFVNTPWKGAVIWGPRIINEVHGKDALPPTGHHQYSFDGSHCFDYDVQAIKERFATAQTFFFWFAQCNGRKKETDPTPRPKRTAWPSVELIGSAVALARQKGEVTPYKKGIYKTHSDQHTSPPAPRELKPVFIVPLKGKKISLIGKDGTVLGTAPYFGPFTGGGYRYYLGEWGYQIADKARRTTGTSIVTVALDGKVLGTIDPAFRDWKYR